MRTINADHDVTVQLADGLYRLARPLLFTALDGGRNGHQVIWAAAAGASLTANRNMFLRMSARQAQRDWFSGVANPDHGIL